VAELNELLVGARLSACRSGKWPVQADARMHLRLCMQAAEQPLTAQGKAALFGTAPLYSYPFNSSLPSSRSAAGNGTASNTVS
jgi:hypothetical protein